MGLERYRNIFSLGKQMANGPDKRPDTEAGIRNDLTKLFRENDIVASDKLSSELASALKDGIRTGFEKTVQSANASKIKPKP